MGSEALIERLRASIYEPLDVIEEAELKAAAADALASLERDKATLSAAVQTFGDYGDDPVEVLARAMTVMDGQNPNDLVSYNEGPFDKRWKQHEPEAARILNEMRLSRAQPDKDSDA